MDPNINRNSLGSRAGPSLRNNLGGGAIGAPSRLGTVSGRVTTYLIVGKHSFGSGIHCQHARPACFSNRRYHWPFRSLYAEAGLWQELLRRQDKVKIAGTFLLMSECPGRDREPEEKDRDSEQRPSPLQQAGSSARLVDRRSEKSGRNSRRLQHNPG